MKKVLNVFLIFIMPFVLLFLVGFFLFHEREYKIKTEYGDSFIICGGGFDGEYCILDNMSTPIVPIEEYNGKKDLKPVCDSTFFRAYRFVNEEEDIYIMKIKKYDNYFIIDKNDDDYTEYLFNSNQGKNIKNEFLCDDDFMKITFPYIDQVYHDEIMQMYDKLKNGDYEGLDAYGFTKEMAEDKEAVDKKIAILEEFYADDKLTEL